jgi:hypothetical protein
MILSKTQIYPFMRTLTSFLPAEKFGFTLVSLPERESDRLLVPTTGSVQLIKGSLSKLLALRAAGQEHVHLFLLDCNPKTRTNRHITQPTAQTDTSHNEHPYGPSCVCRAGLER